MVNTITIFDYWDVILGGYYMIAMIVNAAAIVKTIKVSHILILFYS